MLKVRHFILLILLAKSVLCANILFLCGMASPSHHIWNRSIMKALVERGHNLTILGVEKDQSMENLHFIHMDRVHETLYEFFMSDEISTSFDFSTSNFFTLINQMYQYYSVTSAALVKSAGIQTLRNYPDTFKFDLIIHDFTQGQVLLGFVNKFGYPPLISISAFNIPPHIYAVSGTPSFPSYVPHIVLTVSSKMKLYDRIKNLICHTYDWYYRNFIYMVNENKLAKDFFGESVPSLETIEQKTVLVLVNADFTIEYPRLLPANVIPVGGLQVKRQEEIPENVQEFLKRSTSKGVVLFSLGTNMQSIFLGSEKINTFINVFRNLSDYDFIWKYEGDDLVDIPSNLLCIKWLPQNSILNYPKLKLFISHGGLLSVQESIWHGIPVLGVPFFVDQHQNMLKIVNGGMGRLLNINALTFNDLRDNLLEILENSKYKNQVVRRSKQFRNQQSHPLDRATYWIEYILENGGEHLRLPAIDMPFYQIYMLDILAIVILLIAILIFILSKLILKTKKFQNKLKNKNKQE